MILGNKKITFDGFWEIKAKPLYSSAKEFIKIAQEYENLLSHSLKCPARKEQNQKLAEFILKSYEDCQTVRRIS